MQGERIIYEKFTDHLRAFTLKNLFKGTGAGFTLRKFV